MEYNPDEVKAVKNQLTQNISLLNAYLSGTPANRLAKQMGISSYELEAHLQAILKGHTWLFAARCPEIDVKAHDALDCEGEPFGDFDAGEQLLVIQALQRRLIFEPCALDDHFSEA